MYITSVFPYTGVWRRFAVDFGAILRETAREVYSILDRAAPVWSPNEGRRFHAKEPQKHIAYTSVFRERSIQPTVYFVATNSILGGRLP